jgi:hypothetical protein
VVVVVAGGKELLAVGYFWWEIKIKKNKKYNI